MSDISDAERLTTLVASAVAHTAEAMSLMSLADKACVGPAAIADLISDIVEASSLTPSPVLIPAITADARSEISEAPITTDTVPMALRMSDIVEASSGTPVVPRKLLRLEKLLVRALSRSEIAELV